MGIHKIVNVPNDISFYLKLIQEVHRTLPTNFSSTSRRESPETSQKTRRGSQDILLRDIQTIL